MTADTGTPRIDPFATRLAELRAERDRAAAEINATARGDDADRATNVDAYARVAALDDRIAAIESSLEDTSAPRHPAETVSIGSHVGLDFGDGTESFVVAAPDPEHPEVPVVTPKSPLGQALIGARSGSHISYEAQPGQKLDVTVTEVS